MRARLPATRWRLTRRRTLSLAQLHHIIRNCRETVNQRDPRGLTALHIAAASGTRALFARLVAAGAAVDARDAVLYDDADGQRTPLMYAAHYGCLDGAMPCFLLAVRRLATSRLTPQADVSCCSHSAFKALLDLGAELRALSAVGWPPLFYAVENRHALTTCEPPCDRQ